MTPFRRNNPVRLTIHSGPYAFVLTLLLICAPLMGCTSQNNPAAETAATSPAKAWLELIDSKHYAESWDEASEIFKSSIKRTGWNDTISGVRDLLGNIVTREINSTEYRTELPGAPDGEYIVFKFASSFANKKSSEETLTLMLDDQDIWRASEYYIK